MADGEVYIITIIILIIMMILIIGLHSPRKPIESGLAEKSGEFVSHFSMSFLL